MGTRVWKSAFWGRDFVRISFTCVKTISIKFFRELYQHFFLPVEGRPSGYLQHQRAIHTVDLLTLAYHFFSPDKLCKIERL